ncbi:hypothetical protein [Opitutus sp. ER46]|uniref:hypothetical protein n=1 Tax=Opitutus sp. ER46 TaxID=2161864 RepID=UPI000D2FE890|nr:hypothetical protein [Opitutus sp. ER46]PTX90725.1 hypothetical protein DB354_18865 [Opitutus sp. ER46]
MKLARVLLLVGAVANTLFVAFHAWLGWRLHHLTRLDRGIRDLLEMLNGGGTLFILFLGVASWLIARETNRSALGRLVIVTAIALYGLRGLVEFVLPPHVTPWVLGTCAVTTLLYAAVLVADRRTA